MSPQGIAEKIGQARPQLASFVGMFEWRNGVALGPSLGRRQNTSRNQPRTRPACSRALADSIISSGRRCLQPFSALKTGVMDLFKCWQECLLLAECG
jgi:hypothetical protein